MAALLAGLVLCGPAAWSQAPAERCFAATEVTQVHMVGLWRAEFEGLVQGATLLLEKHPEYEGSLSGSINRDGVRGVVAGDVEKGEFTLEESADGKRISATFVGDVVEGSCGREIRGTWHDEEDSPARNFVLRKR
jgi:hypothetical protein